jgi:hypothetical protein
MAVIPVYATLRYTQQDRIRGSPLVKWIWVTLLGLLIWFFGEALLVTGSILQLPGGVDWFSAIDAMNTSSLVIAWFLILVGFVFQARTSRKDKSSRYILNLAEDLILQQQSSPSELAA